MTMSALVRRSEALPCLARGPAPSSLLRHYANLFFLFHTILFFLLMSVRTKFNQAPLLKSIQGWLAVILQRMAIAEDKHPAVGQPRAPS